MRKYPAYCLPNVAVGIVIVMCGLARDASADEKDACADSYVTAQTQRVEHKLLSARDALVTCSRPQCAPFMRGQIAHDCAAWLEEVQTSIPSVILAVRTPAGVPAAPTTVYVDGAAMSGQPGGGPVEVDPGQHVFTFTSGAARVEKTAVVLEGAKGQPIVADLDPRVTESATSSPISARPPRDDDEPSSNSFASPRTLVPLGIGAAGIVVGSIFGGLALGNKAWLDDHCPNGQCTAPAQRSDVDALHTNSWISNVGFGVGVAGVATAAILWLTNHPARSSSGSTAAREKGAALRPWASAGAVGLSGRF